MVPTPEDGRGNPEHRPVQPQTQLRLLMSPDLGKAQSLPACEGEVGTAVGMGVSFRAGDRNVLELDGNCSCETT